MIMVALYTQRLSVSGYLPVWKNTVRGYSFFKYPDISGHADDQIFLFGIDLAKSEKLFTIPIHKDPLEAKRH